MAIFLNLFVTAVWVWLAYNPSLEVALLFVLCAYPSGWTVFCLIIVWIELQRQRKEP